MWLTVGIIVGILGMILWALGQWGMKVCDNCYEEYEKGTGVSENDFARVKLIERFYCDSCADEYNQFFVEDKEGDEG